MCACVRVQQSNEGKREQGKKKNGKEGEFRTCSVRFEQANKYSGSATQVKLHNTTALVLSVFFFRVIFSEISAYLAQTLSTRGFFLGLRSRVCGQRVSEKQKNSLPLHVV